MTLSAGMGFGWQKFGTDLYNSMRLHCRLTASGRSRIMISRANRSRELIHAQSQDPFVLRYAYTTQCKVFVNNTQAKQGSMSLSERAVADGRHHELVEHPRVGREHCDDTTCSCEKEGGVLHWHAHGKL